MSRQVKKPKPLIYVFCEGESEQAYVKFLKKRFSDVAVINGPSSLNCSKKRIDVSERIPNFAIQSKLRMKSGSSLT